MKVAEITTYKEGGIYTHVSELADRINVETLLITGNSQKSGYEEENGKHFFHIPCLFSFFELYFINPLGSARKVHEALKANTIDLVHLHGPLFSFGGSVYRKSSLPIVVTTHYVLDFKGNRVASAIYKIVIRWVTKQMARYAKKIICVNKDYPSIYASWGIDPQKIIYIPNGIDTKKFSPGKSDMKKMLGCQHLLVYWGRLGYQKNIALLIQAFQQVKTPAVKLAIIGKGPDLPKLKHLAAADDQILFPGYLSCDELVCYARGADIAVLPSRGESWGLVIGEAMGCGLPVISSDVGMAQELLGENRGVLLKHETPEELASCIDYLLSHKKEAKLMGQQARSFIIHRYSWDEVAAQIETLYRSCINEKYMD